jgi:cell fate (sporulation/competence/biofilm development) regulator YlbF (YheA/YmcA/DUF963 family)
MSRVRVTTNFQSAIIQLADGIEDNPGCVTKPELYTAVQSALLDNMKQLFDQLNGVRAGLEGKKLSAWDETYESYRLNEELKSRLQKARTERAIFEQNSSAEHVSRDVSDNYIAQPTSELIH